LIGIAEIIVAKHRNGATGDVQLKFKNTYAKFMNKDDRDKDDNPFDSGYQVISSKMNENGGNFYGNGTLSTPQSSNPLLTNGRSDDVPF